MVLPPYDGTNAVAAKAATKAFLDGYSSKLPAGASFEISMNGSTTVVALHAGVQTSLMQIAGVQTIPVTVSSNAVTPLKPKSVTFRPTKAQGYY